MLLLKELKQHQSQSDFLPLVARHTLDIDESIRSFCLSALQDAGMSTLESVLGEEGVLDTLRRIAATPFNEAYHSLVTHFLRYAILKTAQRQDLSLPQLDEASLLQLLSEGSPWTVSSSPFRPSRGRWESRFGSSSTSWAASHRANDTSTLCTTSSPRWPPRCARTARAG